MKAFQKLVVSASVNLRRSSSCSLPNKARPSLLIRYPNSFLQPSSSNPTRQFFSTPQPCTPNPSEPSDTSLVDPVLSPENAALLSKLGKTSCAYFDSTGTLITKSRELSKAEIAEQFDLRHRDLRDIDIKSESTTRILIRPATILLQFFDLCMIIQSNETLLIDLLKSRTGDNRPADFYRDFERRLQGQQEAADIPELPYELRAVEAGIVAVLSDLRHNLVAAKQEAEYNIQHLSVESGLAAVGLDLLFESSRRLGKIEQRARLVRDTIREVLDTDEDLAAMYLTDRVRGKPHPVADHQEAEYMLEAYHTAADGLAESAHSSISMIRKKEAVFRSSLAVQRNQIMFLEAKIAIHTLGLAAGTLVAGLFGMNLVNYFEEATYGFPVTTGVCVALSAVFSVFGMRSIRKIQRLKIQDRTFGSQGK